MGWYEESMKAAAEFDKAFRCPKCGLLRDTPGHHAMCESEDEEE